MSRRDISKREKLREEERELDKQLKDAGVDTPGMSYDEKKEILAMLDESRKFAQEEENQRKHLLEEEEQILHATLNQSSQLETDEVDDAPKEKGHTINAVNSVAPDASQVCETDCISSGSSTPDLLPLPSESPSKVNQYKSPVRSTSNPLVLAQSPRHSEDMFLFSQTSTKLGVDESVIQDCIETIKVSESEDEDQDISCTPPRNTNPPRSVTSSPSVKNKTPAKQMHSDITSSVEKTRNSPHANVSAVKPRPSLRRYQSDDLISTPSPRSQKSESEEVKCSSQPLSLEVKKSQLSKLVERMEDNSLISPVIGQRRLKASNEKLSLPKTPKVTSIQDAEISNSLCVKPIRMTSPDLISDDDANGAEIHSSSESHLVLKEEEEADSSSELNIFNGSVVRNKVMKRKMAELDTEISSKMKIVDQLASSADRVTMRKSPKITRNPTFPSMSLSDSDEDQIVQNKKDGKKNIDVFFTVEGDIYLTRKAEKCEDPKTAYFRNADESANYAYERILDLINKSFSDVEKYQSTLACRMKWPAPIKVDRRVKDSLDHPKVSSRRQMELPPMTCNAEPSRVLTRHSQQKTSGVVEEDASLSEGSLPDNGGWLDARKKNTNKRKGVQLGLSRKQAKFAPTSGTEGRLKVGVNSVNILHDSDSEDFDLTSVATRLSPVIKRKGTATPGNASIVKNNRITSLSEIEEDKTNFDIGDILTHGQECASSSSAKDNEASTSKEKPLSTASLSWIGNDSQPSTSGLKYPSKRPRKTFRLTVDSDEEPLQNSEASSTFVDKMDASLVRSLTMIQSTKAQDNKEDKSLCVTTSESKYFSGRKKDPMLFVSSFEGDVKSGATARENSDEDLCVIDSSSTSRSVASSSKRGRGNPVQLKPAPLRLKNKRVRGQGKTTAMDGSQRDDDIDSQPPSTSEVPQQMSRSAKVTEKTLEEEVVECPLCQKPFPITVIEAHASNCGEPSAEVEQQPTVSQNASKRRLEQREDGAQMVCSSDDEVKVARITTNRNRRERTPPNFARCVHCSGVFKEGDLYLLHVKECQRRLRETSNMSSPSSRTPIQGRRSPEPSGSSSNHMRMKAPVTQSTSVFERLEGESL